MSRRRWWSWLIFGIARIVVLSGIWWVLYFCGGFAPEHQGQWWRPLFASAFFGVLFAVGMWMEYPVVLHSGTESEDSRE